MKAARASSRSGAACRPAPSRPPRCRTRARPRRRRGAPSSGSSGGSEQRLAGLVLEQHQRAADHGAVAQRDHPRGDPVPPPQPLGAALLRHAHRLAAADQVAQLHGLAGHEPAHLVEADHGPAQPGDVVARGRALLPAAPAEVVVRDVAAVRQVGGEQVLEGGAPEDSGGVVAEDVLDLLRRDAGAGASLGAVALDQRREGAAPLLPLGPCDQPGDVVRRGQGGGIRSRNGTRMVYRGSARGLGGGEADPVRSVHRLGNGHPEWWAMLRSEIVLFQRGDA
jgi:hypothetical protein